jgi:hypothetical protein
LKEISGATVGAADAYTLLRKKRRARRSASAAAASGVDCPEATAAHICTMT